MFALFEEAGKFQTGRVLAEAEASAQIELDSGKRVKVKAANILLKFDQPSPADLMREAQALAGGIELELAWEFAPEHEFGFADLAREYFSDKATLAQQVAALLRLFESPHYFRRAGRGRFRKAPAEILQQALVAIEKKKQVQAQIAAWAAELAAGSCPGAHPRAAVQDPVQARQERRRVQGRGRGLAGHPQRAAGPAAARRRDRFALPVPLEAFPVRELSPGHGLPRAAGPGDPRRAAAGRGARLLHRRLQHDGDRRRAVGAGPGFRHGDGGRPHRGTGPGAAAGHGDRPGGAPAPVDGLHARLQDHHAARRRGAGLHPAGRTRLPRRFALCRLRRGHAGAQGDAHPAGTRAHRGQPAPRPARCADHRGMAARPGPRRRTRCRRRSRHCASRCRSCSGWPRT